MDGIAAIQARIQEIESRLADLAPGGGVGGRLGAPATGADPTAGGGTSDFAAALASAQQAAATGISATSAPAPSATGSLNRAGVDPAQWARDFLNRIGMPVTNENMRAMTAWQKAEGTAARFNPLATTQGGFAGATNFNSVGVKNFTSYQDGIEANAKVINNGLYSNILAALQSGNDAMAVARAVKDSPWGTGGLVERILQSQSS